MANVSISILDERSLKNMSAEALVVPVQLLLKSSGQVISWAGYLGAVRGFDSNPKPPATIAQQQGDMAVHASNGVFKMCLSPVGSVMDEKKPRFSRKQTQRKVKNLGTMG